MDAARNQQLARNCWTRRYWERQLPVEPSTPPELSVDRGRHRLGKTLVRSRRCRHENGLLSLLLFDSKGRLSFGRVN
jgi:hypothetical protein